jgi:hypothetical protein
VLFQLFNPCEVYVNEGKMMMALSRVYHVSAEHGRRVFSPRRFWHSAERGLSARLEEGAAPPAGMSAIYAVFAWKTPSPLYFAPHPIKRLSLNQNCRKFKEAASLLGMENAQAGEIIVFQASDREQLRRHSFSIYEFAADSFSCTPNGEYISLTPVAPLSETALSNVIVQIQTRGIEPAFVPDIEECYLNFRAAGIQFATVTNIESVMKDFEGLKNMWGVLK